MKADSLHLRALKMVWGARSYVMGILNLTPDSFSGDGLLASGEKSPPDMVQAALAQARRFAAAGADMIDVGGESTRPGAEPVSVDDELARIEPVVRTLRRELEIPISVDTYKARVAEVALAAGADMINDVWGLMADPELAEVVARHGAPVVLMHNRSSWAQPEIKQRLGGRYIGAPYENLVADIQRELLDSVAVARQAGIPDEKIILDPGIGFGKTVEQNLELLDRLDEIRDLGFPVLLGPSRKSFIGYTLDLPPEERLEGTAATVTIGIARGADIIRVHDVGPLVRVIRMTDAITRRQKEQHTI
ncbi:MAG TPA: dihydropteroate synthase [Anaerolineales bacterium]|nr:dihydropteroate synthase [Anaerolineales bacterium]